MFRVNLEKKLIKENALTSEQETFLNFAKSVFESSERTDQDLLSRCGFHGLVTDSATAINTNKEYLFGRKQFGNRLFTEEQIKIVALKYNLKFLPTNKYKGSIPTNLALVIRDFFELTKRTPDTDFYILAPKTSFKLQERPKDPLLFYKDKYGFYVLVHKWGNDLSVFNRVVGIWKIYHKIIMIFSVCLISLTPFCVKNNIGSNSFSIATFIVILFIGLLATSLLEDTAKNYKNNWNSPFKD